MQYKISTRWKLGFLFYQGQTLIVVAISVIIKSWLISENQFFKSCANMVSEANKQSILVRPKLKGIILKNKRPDCLRSRRLFGGFTSKGHASLLGSKPPQRTALILAFTAVVVLSRKWPCIVSSPRLRTPSATSISPAVFLFLVQPSSRPLEPTAAAGGGTF